ncbi:TetR/AcrR family transcriptional regulator [Nocardiopsis halophila]|uniref:TetR/AcrR family transcriptional regulator n=1 Tax=Nocardiopsis halophila TaxID=141692 RepID=UPI001267ED9B|nr:TetR/AcrR family transcriptional regulator [Nocardiopsis halophila]
MNASPSASGSSGPDSPTVPVPPWRKAPRPTARRPLSTAAVVEAALRIMAEEGPAGVTMRRVAQALDTGPASLYAHVRDKQDLHELMLDEVFAGVPVPVPDPARWRDQLREHALLQLRVLMEHPGSAEIAMRTVIPTTPRLLAHMDAQLGILRAGGMGPEAAGAAGDLLALYGTAFAFEQEVHGGLASGAGAEDVARRVGEITGYLRSLPQGMFPHLAAVMAGLSPERGDVMRTFEFGLDAIIAGIERAAERDKDRETEHAVAERGTERGTGA